MGPRLVVWDLSGVLTQERSTEIDAFGERCELPSAAWLRVFDEVLEQQRAWDAVEVGNVTLEDFAQRLSDAVAAAGGFCPPSIAKTLWGDPDPFSAGGGVRADLMGYLEQIRDRVSIALATNNIREWRPVWSALVAPSRFDFVFESCEMGVRKPDPRFYAHIERATGLRGREILLIDDRGVNVTAASTHGWRAIQFASVSQCISELDRHLRGTE